MGFLTLKRTIGFGLETSPKYAKKILDINDYDICAYNINYDPEIAMKARKCAKGNLSNDESVAGKRSVSISFSHDFQYNSSALTSPPNYFKCLEACGLKQTILAGGVTLIPDSDYTNVPATIEVVEKDEGTSPNQVVIMAYGCMGNAKLILDSVGEPLRIEFEFKGVLYSIEDRSSGSILTPTGFNTAVPDAVLSSSLTMFSEDQQIDTVTLDFGNTVELYTDPSSTQGFSGAHIVGRNPTLELDPDLELIADRGDYARWIGDTTGAFSMTIGSNLSITAPAVQYIKAYTAGDREGHVTSAKSLELRGSAGDDDFKILQGVE